MIEDTTWDVYEDEDGDWSYVMVNIHWPGGDIEEFTLEDMGADWPRFHLTGVDKDYIINQFGITDEITIQELYNRYIKKLRPFIYDEMFNYGSGDVIYESTDRVHQFLDKVLDFLKDDTYFTPDDPRAPRGNDFIKLPFFDNPIPVKTQIFHTGYDLLMVLTDTPYPVRFERYCIDNYGLDKNSLKTIWEVYSGYILELVSKKYNR